ncbi:MAG: hypothetical protein JST00_26055 [Deltaproteobacteria bacterium]|nr:hypothetical protein [Deltaproteobacteria bacterium]
MRLRHAVVAAGTALALVAGAAAPAHADDAPIVGDRLLTAFREGCEAPAGSGEPPRVSPPWRCEELAFEAGRAFGTARRRGKALAAFRSLVAYGELTGAGMLARRAVREIALSYQALALYEPAVEWHERYAVGNPTLEGAPESMTDAVALLLGLGDVDRATKDVDLYLRTWGTKRAKEATALLLALAQHHAEHGASDKARAILTKHAETFDGGPLDHRVRAHALAAKLAPPSKSAAEHAIVRDLWSDPHRAERDLRLLWSEEEEARVDRRLARVLVAVGDARLAEADAKRLADVDGLRYPAFARAVDPKGVETFAEEDVKPWFLKKRAAIEAVEALYVKVLDVQPIAPPRAAIASAAEVAKMWGSLADDLLRGPAVPALARDTRLRRLYREAVAPFVETALVRHAKPTMKTCVALAVKYQMPDSPARECEAWLVRHAPDEWRPVEELVPALRVGRASPAMAPLPAEGDVTGDP